MGISPQTPVFPGYPQPIVRPWTYLQLHGYYANLLVMVEHTATHVDSPAHFVEGAPTVDAIPPEKFVSRAVAVDVSDVGDRGRITWKLVEERLPRGAELGPGWALLLRTGFDEYAGTPRWLEHPDVDEELADHLASLGVNALGVDAPSPDHQPFNVHRILLGRGVLIYENVTNLREVVGRVFTLVAPPIRIVGGSGAPVRALAILD